MLLIGDLYNMAADTATTESVVGDAVKEATDQVSIVGQYIQKLTDWCMSKLGSIVVAVIFMVVCFKLVKLLLRILRKSFERSKLDPSVAGFFISAVKIVLNVLIVLTAASIVGFQITSFITRHSGGYPRTCTSGKSVESCGRLVDSHIKTIQGR